MPPSRSRVGACDVGVDFALKSMPCIASGGTEANKWGGGVRIESAGLARLVDPDESPLKMRETP